MPAVRSGGGAGGALSRLKILRSQFTAASLSGGWRSLRHVRRLPDTLLLKLAVAAALSLAVVMLAPRIEEAEPGVPPAGMLLATAALVALICAVALAWGLQSDLGLPAKVAVYAVVFNAAVIAVKLWLAPRGFYEVNQARDLDGLFAIDDPIMAFIAGGLVFALYFGVYFTLYRLFRNKVVPPAPSEPKYVSARGVFLTIGISSILLVATGGAVLLALVPLAAGLDYLDFVFSSGVSLLIALALAAATALAALAFDATSKRAHVVGDATMYMSFFWVGLYFLALYHALWVVYVLLLTSIWPLKVVTPK